MPRLPSLHYCIWLRPYSGPCPMQLVVVMAVKKAVSAATITFTATSIRLFFFITLTSYIIHHSPPPPSEGVSNPAYSFVSSKTTSLTRFFATANFWATVPLTRWVTPVTTRTVSGENKTRRVVMFCAPTSSAFSAPMLENPTLKMPMPSSFTF